jgi:hypothetical protein
VHAKKNLDKPPLAREEETDKLSHEYDDDEDEDEEDLAKRVTDEGEVDELAEDSEGDDDGEAGYEQNEEEEEED